MAAWLTTSVEDEGDFDYYLDTPFSEEVLNVFKSLKNNKACGVDSLTNELLKAASDFFLTVFTHFFNLVLMSGKCPVDWTVAVIKPLFKHKGNIDNPNNYRGISLLSCFSKAFTTRINNRLSNSCNKNYTIGMEQAGFRAGHSVNDHMFTLHAMIEFFLHMKKRLYCIFIDYEKAFDFINRSFLWQKLLASGVKGKMLYVIKDMYKKAKSSILWNNDLSEHFICSSGGKQGENVSTLLFFPFI
eukprot:TRINITY_DN12129_c0_g1_i7.p1 TRINITY_DN12129_c0_g1~~TRINITY_DN12129_c0_g1_i7.p1  ORF type:complete len:243 (+),score=18.33 TRINITY_DN12129_c0_g1_i7:90-818(+)